MSLEPQHLIHLAVYLLWIHLLFFRRRTTGPLAFISLWPVFHGDAPPRVGGSPYASHMPRGLGLHGKLFSASSFLRNLGKRRSRNFPDWGLHTPILKMGLRQWGSDRP